MHWQRFQPIRPGRCQHLALELQTEAKSTSTAEQHQPLPDGRGWYWRRPTGPAIYSPGVGDHHQYLTTRAREAAMPSTEKPRNGSWTREGWTTWLRSLAGPPIGKCRWCSRDCWTTHNGEPLHPACPDPREDP